MKDLPKRVLELTHLHPLCVFLLYCSNSSSISCREAQTISWPLSLVSIFNGFMEAILKKSPAKYLKNIEFRALFNIFLTIDLPLTGKYSRRRFVRMFTMT